MPGRHPIVVRQGQHLTKGVRVTSRTGRSWVFSETTRVMKVRRTPPSVKVILDASARLSVDPDDAERLVLDLPANVTAPLPVGEFAYDLFVDGVPVLGGPFVVEPGVSR